MIKNYYHLTKPGIIYGNLITTIGGFFFALGSHHIDYYLLINTLLGVCFIIASGCVFNNIIDSDIDGLMQRTKNRVMVLGLISNKHAVYYGIILGILGILCLLQVNYLTLIIACSGWLIYVVAYTILLKRRSTYSTIIGSFSGSMPIIIGYCAVTNNFNLCALLLFIILSLWQMPHSYAIAINLLKDYQKTSVMVLPIKYSLLTTKIHMIVYVLLFLIMSILLHIYGYANNIYLLIMSVVGSGWLIIAIYGLFINQSMNNKWAKKMFVYSIIVIMVFSVTIIGNYQ